MSALSASVSPRSAVLASACRVRSGLWGFRCSACRRWFLASHSGASCFRPVRPCECAGFAFWPHFSVLGLAVPGSFGGAALWVLSVPPAGLAHLNRLAG